MEEINGLAPEVQPVADQDLSAPSSPETASGEGDVTPEEKAAKTFTQEELDAILEKRLAKEQRKAERERERLIADILARQQKPEQPAQEAPSGKPQPGNFATTEEYVEAVAEWKAKEILKAQVQEQEIRNQQTAAERHMAELQAEYQERVEAAVERYDDFEEVTSNPNLRISPVMAEAIVASDVGPDVAYYLGVNPKEAERISKLPPFLQVKEIGRLEAKVMAEPPAKKSSSAPPPINPGKPKSAARVTDTLNPKSLEQLGTSEWIRLEEQRMRRKLEAGNR